MHPWLLYDKAMLQSLINMKLRDYYDSLKKMCDDLEIDYDELLRVLHKHHLVYVPDLNQLRDDGVTS